jgi:hypothetical protein
MSWALEYLLIKVAENDSKNRGANSDTHWKSCIGLVRALTYLQTMAGNRWPVYISLQPAFHYPAVTNYIR